MGIIEIKCKVLRQKSIAPHTPRYSLVSMIDKEGIWSGDIPMIYGENVSYQSLKDAYKKIADISDYELVEATLLIKNKQ